MESSERIFLNSVFFVLGFTLVFSIIGILLQTLLLHASFGAMEAIRIIGGLIILAFGILLIASTRYIIPFFSQGHGIRFKRTGNSFVSSFLFGLGFAMGWTPCVGAILGSIYALAAASPGVGFLLLLAYSLGLGIPFLVFGAFISKLSGFLKRIKAFLNYFSIIAGLFLAALGILVVTGYIGLLSVFLVGPGGSMPLGSNLNFLIAILAGILTFFSPCILPLVPAFFSYMAGSSAEGVKQ
ncbi:MAG: sulfite exporter TauE/SafE family protein [Candidatus Micrarchaeota archaeon]|nr:sulfite exporter TauE/SafE family protein [Candidatus Micrarchaeota archaeon]